MKKIAFAIISIGLVFALGSCSWKLPETISVKTNADYEFSLGNVEKDLSDKLGVSNLIGTVELPNNGKIYDYWPKKSGDTQKFLMYMPLQNIPIDISDYFDKGALADSISNISFEKEFEVPTVDFSYNLDIDLDEVNEQICNEFRLAGIMLNYGTSTFSQIYNFADKLSFKQGTMKIAAYNVDISSSSTSVNDIITTIDTSYNGTVYLRSNGKTVSGTFYNGVAEINLSSFIFKTSDISIEFSETSNSKAFIATIDTSNKSVHPYQINSVEGLTLTQPISYNFTQNIDGLSGLDTVEGCTIGDGDLTLKFSIPTEWKNVNPSYEIELTGGINLESGVQTAATSPATLPLDNKSITTDDIHANVDFNIVIANATIDFEKKPSIGIGTKIREIESVTVKLSNQSLSFNETQEIPEDVLKIVKELELHKCGVKGTYTNTLPSENVISLSVFSNFFDIHDVSDATLGKNITIEGGKTNSPINILSGDDDVENYTRTVKLESSPSASDEFNAFDFKVDVILPGGEQDKITVKKVKPGTTYTFAINLEPVIDWESVTINLDTLPSMSDTMGTGFNPSSLYASLEDSLGKEFAENIELPDCKLYLYLTRPDVTVDGDSVFENLDFGSSSVRMFYGTNPSDGSTPTQLGAFEKPILTNGKAYDENGNEVDVKFVAEPNIVTEKNENGDEVVISEATVGQSLMVSLKELLSKPDDIDEDTFKDSQLCVDYDISLSGTGSSGIKITKAALENSESGSIGIFALLELPVRFQVKDDDDGIEEFVEIDLSSITGDSSNTSNSSSSGSSDSSDDSIFSKYIDAVDSLEIKYTVNQLPITFKDVQIGIDLFGTGTIDNYYKLEKSGIIPFGSETVKQLQASSDSISPKIKLRMKEGASISMTRDKSVNVYVEVGLKTDGIVQIK